MICSQNYPLAFKLIIHSFAHKKNRMKLKWWKILCIIFLFLTFTAGFLIPVPFVGNLHQSIRNFFFHVPMWFGMIGLLSLSLGYSIAYLRTQNLKHDIFASEFAKTGIVFGIGNGSLESMAPP